MSHLLVEYASDQPEGGIETGGRYRNLRLAKAPRIKWLHGWQSKDGRTVYSDAGGSFTITHDSFGEFEVRLEVISPSRKEDVSLAGTGGFVGDIWSRCARLASVIEQGIPFALTIDDNEGDEDPPIAKRRRMNTVVMRNVSVGFAAIQHQDREYIGLSGGSALDGFAVGDVVFLEDIRDPTRFEVQVVGSIQDSQNLTLDAGTLLDYESGSILRHAFYYPKCLGTLIQLRERAGRKSPGSEVWDLTFKFVTLRESQFQQFIRV